MRPFAFSFPDNEIGLHVSSPKLREHVTKLSSEFVPRDSSHPENLRRAADYIREEFLTYNRAVNLQDYSINNIEYFNVISDYGLNGKPRVIIGAHYDAFSEFPGADDNASGVAGLLELGKLLAEQPITTPVSLVAYTLEEPPYFATELMGSAVHARSLKENGEKIRLMISLEMIGYFSDEENSQTHLFPIFNYLYPSRANFIAVVDTLNFNLNSVSIKNGFRKCSSVDAVSLNAPANIPGLELSDHLSYRRYGYEAVMITNTAFFRNFNYHTEEDTAEKLDYGKMIEVVKGVYCYLKSLE